MRQNKARVSSNRKPSHTCQPIPIEGTRRKIRHFGKQLALYFGDERQAHVVGTNPRVRDDLASRNLEERQLKPLLPTAKSYAQGRTLKLSSRHQRLNFLTVEIRHRILRYSVVKASNGVLSAITNQLRKSTGLPPQ